VRVIGGVIVGHHVSAGICSFDAVGSDVCDHRRAIATT
jgi:hypothetical protein